MQRVSNPWVMERLVCAGEWQRVAGVGSLVCLLLLTMMTGAASAEETASTASSIDLEARRGALSAAEDQFNQAARARDRQTFQGLLSSDTVFLAGELHSGRLAVMAIWQHLFDGKYDFRYEASALDVTMADSGEFGWAVGEVVTSFQRPGLTTTERTEGHYLHVWTYGEDGWELSHAASLVVHPSLGAARDPRSGLMTAWPELADTIGSHIDIQWQPEQSVRAASGELAYTFGPYSASFTEPVAASDTSDEAATEAEPKVTQGDGHFLAVWQKDAKGHWQLAAEGFTPPGIYGDDP